MQSRKLLKDHLALGFLAALVVLFTALDPNFISPGNIRSIAFALSITLIASCGAAFIILMGSIDLSVGAVASISGMVAAWLAPQLGLWVLVIGPVIGLICGISNGALFVFLRIPSILVTLGVSTSLSGVVLFISNGESIPVLDQRLTAVAQTTLLNQIPSLLLIALFIYFVTVLLHEKTRFGRILHSVGRDEATAQLLGAPLDNMKILALSLSGLLAGIAGTLLMSRLGTGAASMGDFLMLETITAVVVGGTAITGGAGGVRRTLVGAAIIVVLSNGMNVISLHPYLQVIIKGLTILIAVLLTGTRLRAEDVK